jgi:antitoxin (DNA-binding transcriptional repressor) of toxin-antitoxin stability system
MTTIEISQSPPSLNDLVKLAQAGAEVLLTQGGQPVARLMPAQPAVDPSTFPPRKLGLFPGGIWMSDDFDDPLPDEFWLSGDP